MSDCGTTSDVSATERPHRPWYCLHASTWVVAGLAAVVLAVIVASPVGCWHDSVSIIGLEYERGWPWLYATYISNYDMPSIPGYPRLDAHLPAWIDWRLWRLNEPVLSFDVPLLCCDVAAATAIVTIVTLAWELWRRRRRRIWQFHLVDLLGTMFAVAAAAAWWSAWQIGAESEREAASRLSPRDHVVMYHAGPKWLLRLTGHRWCPAMFYRAAWIYVDVDGYADDADALAPDLRACPYATVITLNRAVPDEAWDAIGEKKHLWGLTVTPPAFTDAAVARLARLQSLAKLSVEGEGITQISESGMRPLGEMQQLTFLALQGVQFPTEATRHLARLAKLETLDLSRSSLDDDGLFYLAKLPKLAGLSVEETQVSDAGLQHLRVSTTLTKLILDHTAVTDECLPALGEIPNLRSVTLMGTLVTAEAVGQFVPSHPHLDVRVECPSAP